MAQMVTARMASEMRRQRARGMTRSDIAAHHGVSEGAVQRHTKDVPPPPQGWMRPGRKRIVDREQAARLRQRGYTLSAIAERYGVSAVAVSSALRAGSANIAV